MTQQVTVITEKSARIYRSYSSLSRVLSGNGTDKLRHKIASTVNGGGDLIGNVYVEGNDVPRVTRHRKA